MTPPLENYRTKADWLSAAISEHVSDECLMWPFAVDRDGYGRVCFYGNGKKERVFAHRVSFRLTHGRWPEPCGLHSCDVPGCFNPRHIFEGTCADDHADQVKKGRTTRGVMQRDAKLTDDQVRLIRAEYVPRKHGFHRLAKKYGVSKPIIMKIIKGKLWSHVR